MMKFSRRQFTLAILAAAPATVLACAPAAQPSPTAAPAAPAIPTATAAPAAPAATATPAAAPAAATSGMDALIAAAKTEGELTVIALPRDWLNYGDLLDGFKTKYGLKINELNPNAGSGDEVEAI